MARMDFETKKEVEEFDDGAIWKSTMSYELTDIKIENEVYLEDIYFPSLEERYNPSEIQLTSDEEVTTPQSGIDSSEKTLIPKKYHCAYCNFLSDNRYEFKKHIRRELDKQINDNYLKSILNNLFVPSEPLEGKFRCEDCSFSCRFKSSLKRHILGQHKNVKSYSCLECSYKCLTNQNLKKHMFSKHDRRIPENHVKYKTFSCPHCDFTAVVSSHIKRHQLMQHDNGPKPYPCPICDYSTVQSHHLKRHISDKHNDSRPFSCDKCDYKTKRKSVLKKHVKSKHTNKKPYRCPKADCTFRTARLDYVKTHFAVKHSSEKRLVCPYCTYSAGFKQCLKVHVSKYHRIENKENT